jgi:acetyl-CoA C-acetyltransferase
MLEGVMQPEQFLVGAVGGHMKPVVRIHTAGSVGATTALAAVTHVASGLFDRVLTIAFEKQSEGNAMWALSPNMPFMPRRWSPVPAATSRPTSALTSRAPARRRTSGR